MKAVAVKKPAPKVVPAAPKRPLYEVAAEYRAAAEALHNSDLPDEVIRDTLDGMDGELRDRAIAVAAVVLNLEAEFDGVAAAVDRMTARKKALASKIDHLRDYLCGSLVGADYTEIRTDEIVIRVGEGRESVKVVNEAAIPPEFMRIKPAPAPEPDKRAILDALKGGTQVAGCEIQRNPTLTVK